jgi:gamma-glutamyltranspeptidase/glutathione hydrolase
MMANKGMVVAAQPEAAEAGLEALRAGGNAVDAALACAFVQTAIDPLMCGIAGFGSMAVYMPNSSTHEYVDFHAPAPLRATPTMWQDIIEGETRDGFGFVLKDRVNDLGYQAVCAPAALKAFELASRRYGKLPR